MADKKPNVNMEGMAKAKELYEIDTKASVSMLRDDILLNVFRGAQERGDIKLMDKVESVYREWHKNGILNKDDTTPITATLLIGPPGHGKTTTFKVAAREVAKALGLIYLENADIEKQQAKPGGVTREHLCFVSQETAGVVSALEWAGLPSEKRVFSSTDASGERPAMGRLYSQRLLALDESAGGVLLLDDFLNATAAIQDVGLSLTEEKRYGDLSLTSICIGATGNMGSLDGTNAGKVSSALRNRCQVYFIQDTWQNFVSRVTTDPKYRDSVGWLGIDGYMERSSQNFSSPPDPKMMGGYNTPRSWIKFLDEMRRIVYAHGGREHMSSAIPEISRKAHALLGPHVGHSYTVYMRSLADLADPLARQVIREGKLDTETLAKKFSDGYSQDEYHFAYQYAGALADYTAQKILQDGGNMEEAVTRFAIGISPLKGSSFAYGMNMFKQRLANFVESLSDKVKDGERQLSFAASAQIVKIVSSNPNISQAQAQDMLSTLSDWDKMKTMAPKRARKT